ncbi:MAG: tol-pal system protein YbgF [Pseudomonadota bacterium]
MPARLAPALARRSRPSTAAAIGLLAVMLAAPASAQQAPAGNGGARLSELFYQLQVMQQEVRDLRGQVEEQAALIRRLQRDQKEQYVDIDGRLAALARGGARAGAATPAGDSGAAPRASASASTGSATTASAAGAEGEQADYEAALKLLRERRYDESLLSFNRLLSDYPGGQYAGNALYWLGELYLVKNESERAREQFVQVIDLYSDHPKVPDALYKLGVTYHRLGDKDLALDFLNRVRGRFPTHNAAKLAADYAREMQ